MKRVYIFTVLSIILSSVSLFSMSSEKSKNSNFASEILLNDVVTRDSFLINTGACMDSIEVCIDIPLDNISSYSFTNNGAAYDGDFVGCNGIDTSFYDYSQLFGEGNLGPYMVNSWTVGNDTFSGMFNNISDLLDSMNLWNPTGNWMLDATAKEITGGDANTTYDTMSVTVISISFVSSIPLITETTYESSAIRLPVGTHDVQLIDNGVGTCVDSFFVNIRCLSIDTINLVLAEDSVHTHCFDFSQITGLPSSTEILCPNNSGSPANFDLISGNSCVEITALTIGQDSACYVFCDNMGICDTARIYVEVVPRPSGITTIWITDTLFSNMSDSICIDTSQLEGNVQSIANICPDQSGEYVLFTIDPTTYCVNYSAMDIGRDTACIMVLDDLGNRDTTYLVTEVISPTTDTLIQNIALGNAGSFCIDTTQLAGTVGSILNECEDGIPGSASFTFDPATYCYDVVTDMVGIDTACIIVCDGYMVCDTTILIVNVTDPAFVELAAVDDIVTTTENDSILINVCQNDSIPLNGVLTNIYILPEEFGGIDPSYGTAVFELGECNVVYFPDEDICDVQDQFNYVICNTEGCDTALVTVNIDCEVVSEELVFATGFSPNGDEVNQYFTIKGAENLPNNTLSVYNRWGNQVYKTDNYQNDWDGRWEGSSLQNGTYFFVFNDGAGNTYSGYVYIQK